jgi:hypothetical protein
MKNNTQLNSDPKKGRLDYEVELDKQRILIYNKGAKATYRILIYTNNLRIMQLSNIISGLENRYENDVSSKPLHESVPDDALKGDKP